jgi:CysZ protein
MKDFFQSIRLYGDAFIFIRKHKLSWTFLVPLVVLILLLTVSMGFSAEFTHKVDFWLNNSVLNNESTWYFKLANTFVFGLVWLVFKILFFFIFAYISGFIVLIVLSPILGYLSEKTEQIQTGNEYTFNLMQTIKDIFRGTKLALRNMLIETLFILLFLIMGFIPLLGFLAPLGIFFVSAYFYGFSFFDYTNERHKISSSESIKLMRKNKVKLIGNGSVFAFILLTPIIGSFLSGFIAIIATVAAALTKLTK